MKALLNFSFIIFFGFFASAESSQENIIENLFYRITGLPARPAEVQALQHEVVNPSGEINYDLLFKKLFEHPGFLNIRLSNFVSKMSNEEGEPFEDVDDFQQALALGVTNEIDFRTLLGSRFSITNKAKGNRFDLIETPRELSETIKDAELKFIANLNQYKQNVFFARGGSD